MNSQQEQSMLLAFVEHEDDGRNKICIYGTSGGLLSPKLHGKT